MAAAAQQTTPGGLLSDFAKQLNQHIELSQRLAAAGEAEPGAFRRQEDLLESFGAALDTLTALYDNAAQTLEDTGELLGCAMDEDSADAVEPGANALELFQNAEQEHSGEEADEPGFGDLTASTQAMPVAPRGAKLRKF